MQNCRKLQLEEAFLWGEIGAKFCDSPSLPLVQGYVSLLQRNVYEARSQFQKAVSREGLFFEAKCDFLLGEYKQTICCLDRLSEQWDNVSEDQTLGFRVVSADIALLKAQALRLLGDIGSSNLSYQEVFQSDASKLMCFLNAPIEINDNFKSPRRKRDKCDTLDNTFMQARSELEKYSDVSKGLFSSFTKGPQGCLLISLAMRAYCFYECRKFNEVHMS